MSAQAGGLLGRWFALPEHGRAQWRGEAYLSGFLAGPYLARSSRESHRRRICVHNESVSEGREAHHSQSYHSQNSRDRYMHALEWGSRELAAGAPKPQAERWKANDAISRYLDLDVPYLDQFLDCFIYARGHRCLIQKLRGSKRSSSATYLKENRTLENKNMKLHYTDTTKQTTQDRMTMITRSETWSSSVFFT
eukprot:499497-Rhodomonas_salina.1